LGYDRIFVLNDGKIVEMGKPSELIKKEGLFYELYIQSKI
jgi:ABC-type multidrug transport system fused ATPase/permease subunit